MSDRLQEIRARLDAMPKKHGDDWFIDDAARLIAHAPADIAWLLDEIQELRQSLDIEREWRGGCGA